jgi:outer membrane autotransporter protein
LPQGQQGAALNQLSAQNLVVNLQAGLIGPVSFVNLLDDHLLVGDARTNVEFASLDPAQVAREGLLSDDGTTGAWARGYGTFGNAGATVGNSPFTDSRGGVIAGIDGRFGEGVRGGLAFDYGHTAVNFTDGTGSTSLDSYSIAAYGGWHAGPWYASGVASFGWNDYGTTRLFPALGFNAASGSFSGQGYGAEGQLGYVMQRNGFTLTPNLVLNYAHAHTDAFTETGSAAGLIVNAANGDSLQTTLGIRASTTFATSLGTVIPEVRAGWGHEFLDASETITAAFVSAPTVPFTVTGANYGRDSAVVGAGFTAEVSRDVRFYVDYDGKFQGGFDQNAVSAGFRVRF